MRQQTLVWQTFVVLCFSTLLSACGGGTSSQTLPAQKDNSAQDYVNRTIDIMQANSLYRKSLAWSDIRSASLAELGTAPNSRGIDGALKMALRMLGDHHSFITKANGEMIFGDSLSRSCAAPGEAKPSLPEDVGYIKIKGNYQTNSTATADPATQAIELQGSIKAQDKVTLIGWIVDLRDNGGGNMWPMIAGIGPILGEGSLGYFTDALNQRQRWTYIAGQAKLDNTSQFTVTNPYSSPFPSPKIALLTDCQTGSSGEAVIVAFRGRPNTRSFGTPSFGVSTGNQTFPLSDGATLYLTTVALADRNGVTYNGRIEPDEVIDDTLKVQARAIAWLRGTE